MAGRAAAVAAFAVLLSVFPFAAAPASAAAAPLPPDATVLIRGHGWGHGRGMGQWGARGMAEAGKTSTQILEHYYSGITLSKRDPEPIRVLVETSPDVLVSSASPFKASWTGGSASSTASAPFLRARPTASGYAVERSASVSGPWTRLASPESKVTFVRGDSILELVFGNGTSTICYARVCLLRGTIEARRISSTSIRAINQLPLEQYLYGVVPREMPSSWHAEALEAQSVAARTYSVRRKLSARAAGTMFDICATTMCQVYGGYGARSSPGGTKRTLEAPSVNAAIDRTAGRVMTYDGSPISSEFSSSTGGYTVDGKTSYLKPVPDPYDAISPHHDWTSKLTVSQLESRWPAVGRLTGVRVTERFGCTACQWGGRVLRMELQGTSSTVTIYGNTLRSAYEWPARTGGLKSTWFQPQYWKAQLVSAPSSVSVAAGRSAAVDVVLRNAGNTSWAVGGPVRLASGSSRFADSSWVSQLRPASVRANLDDPGASRVAPGQRAAFRFVLDAADVAPGAYRETFRAIADGLSTMYPRFSVDVTVLAPWANDLPNLLTNGSYESGTSGWRPISFESGDGASTRYARLGKYSLRLRRSAGASQALRVGGLAGRRFVLGAWSRTVGSSPDGGSVGVRARFANADGTTSTVSLPFSRAPHGWRYDEREVVAPKPFTGMQVHVLFLNQTGDGYFDEVRLLDSGVANPSFEDGLRGWTGVGTSAPDGLDSGTLRDGSVSLRMTGGGRKAFIQTIPFDGRSGATYRLAGWSKTVGSSATGGPVMLRVVLHHADGSTTVADAEAPRGPHDWTFVERSVRAGKSFSRVDVAAIFDDQSGDAWFDAIRFGANEVANSSFEEGLTGWKGINTTAADTVTSVTSDAAGAILLQGDGATNKALQQTVPAAGRAGRRLVVSAWNHASRTDVGGGRIGVSLGLRRADGTTEWTHVDWSRAPHRWQYREARVVASKPFVAAVVKLVFYDQTGVARFDGVRVGFE